MTYKQFLAKLLIILKIIVIILPFILFVYLLNEYFYFYGNFKAEYDFESDSSEISHLEPWNRLMPPQEENGDFAQQIKANLVYFTCKVPKRFSEVKIILKFKNEHPFFLIGVQNTPSEDFFEKPIEAQRLEELKWSKMRENEIVFFQKAKRFASYKEFLNSIESIESNKKIGYFYFDLEERLKLVKQQNPEVNLAQLVKIDYNTILEELDFIIAKYPKIRKEGEWKIVEQSFEKENTYVQDNKLKFRLNIPGLEDTIEARGETKISHIEISLTKRALISDIISFIKKQIF